MTPERTQKLLQVLHKRQNNLTVVMENVQDPHNISAVMRTCDAVGIQDIYILNTKIPRHHKFGAKSSSSASKWLSIHHFDNELACFTELRKNYSTILTTHLSSDAVGLYEIDFTKSVALVFGNEHSGVSEEVRALADGNFIIPQMGIIQSLNISVACAVSIYEAYRQKNNAGHYNQVSLPQPKMEHLLQQWGFEDQAVHEPIN
ncbi:MAG: RNA methyltransferase [Chitinophagaceae bacterium]|jgi:tRNA (guanosine-2'-O-)-methyltransferase|nr:RNA methyltransferase [Chitinophagaceae bacterium]